MTITIDSRVSGYNDSPIRIVGVCLPNTGQILVKKIMPFDSKVKHDENTLVVTDSPQFVESWQLAFYEKQHLDEVIRTYQMRTKNGLVQLDPEINRFNPQAVIATRKVDKNGTVQELDSSSLSNGHIAVMLAVWASAKSSQNQVVIGASHASTSSETANLPETMIPFSLGSLKRLLMR